MFNLLIIAALAVPLYFAGEWLLANPGEVHINWLGYDITLHIAVVALMMFLLCLLITFISWLVFKIVTWPQRHRARKKYRTLERGLLQLTQGATALAMGEDDAAHDALKKASLALPDAPLPQLLTAQLLQRQGKHEDAQVYLRALKSPRHWPRVASSSNPSLNTNGWKQLNWPNMRAKKPHAIGGWRSPCSTSIPVRKTR